MCRAHGRSRRRKDRSGGLDGVPAAVGGQRPGNAGRRDVVRWMGRAKRTPCHAPHRLRLHHRTRQSSELGGLPDGQRGHPMRRFELDLPSPGQSTGRVVRGGALHRGGAGFGCRDLGIWLGSCVNHRRERRGPCRGQPHHTRHSQLRGPQGREVVLGLGDDE